MIAEESSSSPKKRRRDPLGDNYKNDRLKTNCNKKNSSSGRFKALKNFTHSQAKARSLRNSKNRLASRSNPCVLKLSLIDKIIEKRKNAIEGEDLRSVKQHLKKDRVTPKKARSSTRDTKATLTFRAYKALL